MREEIAYAIVQPLSIIQGSPSLDAGHDLKPIVKKMATDKLEEL